MQYRGSGSAGGLGVAGGGPMDMGEEEGAPDAVYTLSKSLDPRIVPTKQRYAAPIGAQALTSVNVQLTQLNNTSHTFPVTPPSRRPTSLACLLAPCGPGTASTLPSPRPTRSTAW